MTIHHANAVYWQQGAVLIRGASGAGKSDLSLRLIEQCAARLIADDRVDMQVKKNTLMVMAVPSLQGLLEVYGLGILRLPAEKIYSKPAPLRLVVDLVNPTEQARIPEPDFANLQNIDIPLLSLDGQVASAPYKIHMALLSIGQTGFSNDGIIQL